MSTPLVEVDRLSASYGKTPVLHDVSLTLERGEVLGIIGRSGSGKSSLLRALVGLMRHDAGTVRVDGAAVDYGSRVSVMSARGRLAIVFQQFNLFQNMTVLRNVTLAPCLVKRRAKGEAEREAVELLSKVGLQDKLHAFPDELSGGQQQRVAIARALALKPEILLLDEVTSALDPELVKEVLETVRLLATEGMAMMIVSHEIEFISEVSSKVVMFERGTIVSAAPTRTFFASPEAHARQFLSNSHRSRVAEIAVSDTR